MRKARNSYHSVVFHVAGCADGLVFLHNIYLSSQDAVTVETAEVLQMPVLALSLSILITKDQLWTDVSEYKLNVAFTLSTRA